MLPMRSYTLLLLIVFLLVGGFIWTLFKTLQGSELMRRGAELQALVGYIRDLEGEYALSLQMAAATGERTWIDRCSRLGEALDRNVCRADRLVVAGEAPKALTELCESTRKIIAVGAGVCELAGAGRLEEAAGRLDGAFYRGERHRQRSATLGLGEGFRDEAATMAAIHRRRSQAAGAAALVMLPLMIALWRRSFRHVEQDSAQREIEQLALRQREDRFAKAFIANPDGVIITRLKDGVIVDVNESFCRLLGYSRGEVIQRSEAQLGCWVDADRYRQISGLVEQRGRCTNVETELCTKEGRRLPCLVSARLIRIEGAPCILVLARDITSWKEAEREVRETDRWQALGALAEGMAHSFNNVVAAMAGHARAIVDDVLPHTRVHANAQSILQAVVHATDLTRRLTSFSRVRSPFEELQTEPVSVEESLQRALDIIEHTVREKRIEVRQANKGPWPYVKARADLLTDVLMTVMVNAVEATPPGGSIRIDTIERRISRPRSNPRADGGVFVGVRVRDTGQGLDRESLKQVFEPFFTTKAGVAPLGLGLAMARNMALSMGGWIDIRSRSSVGTIVRVFLAKSGAPAPEEQQAGIRGRTVLVVEDRAEYLEAVRSGLEAAGCRVVCGCSAAEGRDLFRAHGEEIDLVLLDFLVPDGGAPSLMRAVDAAERRPSAVVVMSGFSRDYVRKHMPTGDWAFLQKPFEGARLITVLEQALAGERSKA
jgi:PAS domain S-box-containing protein